MNHEQREEFEQRLENWARVYADRYRKQCSPGFRLYRSPDYYNDGETPRVLDTIDANVVQSAWVSLHARDRVLIGDTWILKAPDFYIARHANKFGATTIHRHNLDYYIRASERRLLLMLDTLKMVAYHSQHNLLTA